MKKTKVSVKSRKKSKKKATKYLKDGYDEIDYAFDNHPVYKKKRENAKEAFKSYDLYKRSLKRKQKEKI